MYRRWIVYTSGVPVLADFLTTHGQGAPLCIDQTAGTVYYLAPGDIPTAIAGGGGGSGLTLTTTEVSLGSIPQRSGKFTISGVGLTPGKPVLIAQAVGPYTSKGTLADEASMDQVSVSASVTDAVTITAYWSSPTKVARNFKFNYQVSA